MESQFEEFRQRIEPYRPVLDRLLISCAAAKWEGKWIPLFLRLMLFNSGDYASTLPEFIRPHSKFFAITNSVNSEGFDAIVPQLVENGVMPLTISQEEFWIFLTRAHAQPTTEPPRNVFSGPVETGNRQSRTEKLSRPRIELHCYGTDRINELLTAADNREISDELRNGDPPINGLRGLLHAMGSGLDPEHATSAQTDVQIAAVLPFSLDAVDGTLEVEAPSGAVDSLKVLYFFSPAGSDTRAVPTSRETPHQEGLTKLKYDVHWPDLATDATANLSYAGKKIGDIDLDRWTHTSNWRVAVDSFFDPNQQVLNSWLARDNARTFEHAIVRLLTLLEVPAIWYGDEKDFKAKPDFAAYSKVNQNWLVVLGECTLQKPSAKFTPMLQRSQELRKKIGQELEIVPAVFTTSVVASTDITQAKEDGIALVGIEEIAVLRHGLSKKWGAKQTVEYLRALAAKEDGTVGIQWQG